MTEEGTTAAARQQSTSTTPRSRFSRICGLNRSNNTKRYDRNHSHRNQHTTTSQQDGTEHHHSHEDQNNVKEEKTDRKKPAPGSDLKEIGLWYGGSLVMNTIVGLGIFGTPKGVLAEVGSVGMTLLIWTFTGIFSMFAALCFVELRESVRKEGVEYAYITEAFGPLAGFVYSWMRIAAAEPTATALFAMVFTDYLTESVFDRCGPPEGLLILLSVLVILSMCLINMLSTNLSERMQSLASMGKIIVLIVIVVMGIHRFANGKRGIINEGMKGTKLSQSQLVSACYNGLWAYGGWSQVNHVTSGIRKPPRNVPRIVKTVIPLVLILYLMVVLSYFTAMSQDDFLNSRAIGMTWAKRVLGRAQPLVSIGVCLTALGSLNATFLSAGRLSTVAAKNGQMPDVASWVHVRSKTPLLVVSLKAVIAMSVVCLASIGECLRFYIFCVWLFHGMSIVALLVLRYKDKKKLRPYKVSLWMPVVVVIVIIYLLLVPLILKPDREFIAAIILLFLSLASYYPVQWIKKKSVFHIPHILTIWLQLFLRVAPKRELRRDRHRSMIRRYLALDTIFHPETANEPRTVFNQFTSLRYPKEQPSLSLDGNALLKRRGSSLRLNHIRHSIDINTSRNNNNNEWFPPYSVMKKKLNRKSQSFNHPDVSGLPILKNRFNPTPMAKKGSAPGALASPSDMRSHEVPPSFIFRNYELHTNNNDRQTPRNEESDYSSEISENRFQPIIMPIYSSTQNEDVGDYELHYDASFPHIPDRNLLFDSGSSSSDSFDGDSESNSPSNLRHTIFTSLFRSDSSSSSSSDEEELSDEDSEVLTPSLTDEEYALQNYHNMGFHKRSSVDTTFSETSDYVRYPGYNQTEHRMRRYNEGSTQPPPQPRKRLSLLAKRPQPAPRNIPPIMMQDMSQPQPQLQQPHQQQQQQRHDGRFPNDYDYKMTVSYV